MAYKHYCTIGIGATWTSHLSGITCIGYQVSSMEIRRLEKKALADTQCAIEEYAKRANTDLFEANSIVVTLMRKGMT